MRIQTISSLVALAMLGACGAKDATATTAVPGEARADTPVPPNAIHGHFDWDKWAAIANEDPCNWLTGEELASLRITGSGQSEVSASGTRCKWTDSEGALVFSASVSTWPGGALNLVGERKAQVHETQNGSLFKRIGSGDGTVIAIHRTDRVTITIFPNADDETAYIYLNGAPTRKDTPEEKDAKRARVEAFAGALIDKYDL